MEKMSRKNQLFSMVKPKVGTKCHHKVSNLKIIGAKLRFKIKCPLQEFYSSLKD
jgi:hypothetical protein